MARLFVMNDNLATRVEVIRGESITGEDGTYAAFCAGCNRETPYGVDLLADDRARFSLEDAVEEVASSHAYRCQNCADTDCLIPTRHVRGHRCRKI